MLFLSPLALVPIPNMSKQTSAQTSASLQRFLVQWCTHVLIVYITVLTSGYKSPHVLGMGWYYSPHPVDQHWHQLITTSSQPLHGHSWMLLSVMTLHPEKMNIWFMALPETFYRTPHPSQSLRTHPHINNWWRGWGMWGGVAISPKQII